MVALPLPVSDYIHSRIVDVRQPAYFLVDDAGCLVDWGGQPEFYGITELIYGGTLTEYLICLDGLLPLPGDALCLQWVETQPGRYADIHLFSSAVGAWILLLDATPEAARHGQMQQKLNDIGLRLKSEPSSDSDRL